MEKKKKVACVIVVVLWVLLVVLLVGVSVFTIQIKKAFSPDYQAVTEVPAPDNAYSLVAKEFTFLSRAGVDLYLLKDGQTEPLGRLGVDETRHPFHEGLYRIEWGKAEVTIRYYSGVDAEAASDENSWKTRTFALPDSFSP